MLQPARRAEAGPGTLDSRVINWRFEANTTKAVIPAVEEEQVRPRLRLNIRRKSSTEKR
jgi:hypothetical protein